MSNNNFLPGISKPKLFPALQNSLGSSPDMGTQMVLEDNWSRQSKTSARFQESVLKAFQNVKGLLNAQEDRLEGLNERQEVLEDSQATLKAICDFNFKSGSDQIQYLLRSSDYCFKLVEVAGEHLSMVASALDNFKSRVEANFKDVQKDWNMSHQTLRKDINQLISIEVSSLQQSLKNTSSTAGTCQNDLIGYKMEMSQKAEDDDYRMKNIERQLNELTKGDQNTDNLAARILKLEEKSNGLEELLQQLIGGAGSIEKRLCSLDDDQMELKKDYCNLSKRLSNVGSEPQRSATPSAEQRRGTNALANSESLELGDLKEDLTCLDDLSLERLQEIRKLITKKIKHVKKRGEAQRQTSQADKEKEAQSERQAVQRPPDSGVRKNTAHTKPEDPMREEKETQRTGVTFANDSEWVTVKRKNWNKLKKPDAGGKAGQSPNRSGAQKESPSRSHQQPLKGKGKRQAFSPNTSNKGHAKNKRNSPERNGQGIIPLAIAPTLLPSSFRAYQGGYDYPYFGGPQYPSGPSYHHGGPRGYPGY